jgi:hypothetical protein
MALQNELLVKAEDIADQVSEMCMELNDVVHFWDVVVNRHIYTRRKKRVS